jgi:hypothetical protein
MMINLAISTSFLGLLFWALAKQKNYSLLKIETKYNKLQTMSIVWTKTNSKKNTVFLRLHS